MKLNIVLPYTLCTKKLNHMIVPSIVIETVFIGDVLKVVYHIDFKCGGINFRKMKATERDFFKI